MPIAKETSVLIAGAGPTGLALAVTLACRGIKAMLIDRWRSGNIFLAGDAAHVHSPAGGQGMNISMQDARLLGDLLAGVIEGEKPEASLDEYERVRRPIAAGVVRMTDRMTRALLARSAVTQSLRDEAIAIAGSLPFVRHRFARRLAELPT
jgi:2-polyprenyl-6-methoxyphenol hydroxylase-like FAD-dependent oxidoreductase